MKTLLILKNARAFKKELSIANEAYAEFEKEIDRLNLDDGINVISKENIEIIQELAVALNKIKKRLCWIGGFCGEFAVYETEKLD